MGSNGSEYSFPHNPHIESHPEPLVHACESSYDLWRTLAPGGRSSLLRLKCIPKILVFSRRHIFISLKIGEPSVSAQMHTRDADLCPRSQRVPGPPPWGGAVPQEEGASLRPTAGFSFSQGLPLTFALGGKCRIPVLALRLCKHTEPGQVWLNVRLRAWLPPLLGNMQTPRGWVTQTADICF